MSKPSSYPPLGDWVKVRDFPDKLRLLLLVQHAIFKQQEDLLAEPDEVFGKSVLEQDLIDPLPTLESLGECWNALEHHDFREKSGKIHSYLVYARLNRLIGWAVTPEGAVNQKIKPDSQLISERLISLFKQRDGLTPVPAGILYRIVRGWRMLPQDIRASAEADPLAKPRHLADKIRPEHFDLSAYRTREEDTGLFRAFCGQLYKPARTGLPISYGDDFKVFLPKCCSYYSLGQDGPPTPAKRLTPFPVHASRGEQKGQPAANRRSERRTFPIRKSSIASEQNSPFDAGFEAELKAGGGLWLKGTVEDRAQCLTFHGVKISVQLEGGPADGFHRPAGDVASVSGIRFVHGMPVSARLDVAGDHTLGDILRDGFQLGQVVAPNDPFVLNFEVDAPLVQIELAAGRIGHNSNSNRTPTDILREYLSSVLAQFEPDWERRGIVPVYRNGRFDFTDDEDEWT